MKLAKLIKQTLLRQVATEHLKAGEPWAEPDPRLPKLEDSTISAQLGLWRALQDQVLQAINLKTTFSFSAIASLRQLLELESAFVLASGANDGPIIRAAFEAFVMGIENARGGLDAQAQAVTESARQAYRQAVQLRGLQLVRAATARTYRAKIIDALSSGEFDGKNPADVARELKRRFAAGDYDWERLARSELAMSQVDGKLEQYRAAGITMMDYVTAEDGRVSAICQSLAANGPYPLDQCPVPVRSSHPNCRCTVMPAAEQP